MPCKQRCRHHRGRPIGRARNAPRAATFLRQSRLVASVGARRSIATSGRPTTRRWAALFAATLFVFLALDGRPARAAEEGTRGVLPIKAMPNWGADAFDGVPQRIYMAAEKQARYLLAQVRPWPADPSLKLLTASASGEHMIRPNTSAIEGFAFLYRFGPYDEQIVGVSRQTLLNETIIPMMRYCTATHVSGGRPTDDGKCWGNAWQSAYWAYMLGRAAWWLWDDLPDDLRQSARKVVLHEADRFLRTAPPYQLTYDTKAEENAWNALIFHAAMLIAPGNPRHPRWAEGFQRWTISSFLRPADAYAQAVIDGRTVAEQFTGANIFDDFTLENHGFVHPDYMTCFGLTLSAQPDFLLSGRKPPEALLYNVREIYDNLKWFHLPDGGYVYPSGQDWELFRNPNWLGIHLEMAVYADDRDAWALALQSLKTLEKMQSRNASGAIFAPGEWYFASMQHSQFRSLAQAWLVLQTADSAMPRPAAPRPVIGVRQWESGKIIIHRTPRAVHSLSWGSVVMAQLVAFDDDRIVSPDQRNGIGHVVLQGENKPLPVKLRSATVELLPSGTQAKTANAPRPVSSAEPRAPSADQTTTQNATPNGFRAVLEVDHGKHLRAKLLVESRPDGSLLLSEELTALTDVQLAECATGLIGILNNPNWVYERGRRAIRFDDRETEAAALSATRVEPVSATKIVIDGRLEITGTAPLRAAYLGATKTERGRATDRLYLNHLDRPLRAAADETISRWEAVLRIVETDRAAK